ncbi:MAG TPA: TlpA disulfide reductase family protein [Burkholderiales bacterium]|nr:TlpA disulfide reductase family protein [Burkholderiales bacterium]
MNRRGQWLAIALVAAGAALAGFAFNAWRSAPQAAAADATAALLDARLPDLDGRPQAVQQWNGRVIVVNFWATWCAPCRDEIPILVKLQEKHGPRGLQFVGIAIDQPDKVRPYATEMRMNFPILIGGAETIELTRKLGNRAGVLPFTVIISRDGRIVAREIGAAKEAQLEAQLLPLL